MLEDFVRPEIRALEAYVPGRSIQGRRSAILREAIPVL